MKIAGTLILRDGTGLDYPFDRVISNMAGLCDEVIVGLDPGFPEDLKTINALGLPNVRIFDTPWDMSNIQGGTEIAMQIEALSDEAKASGADWVVALQADEFLLNDDFDMLKAFMERNQDTDVIGFSLERVYFWKDLETVRKDWNANLVRIFKAGAYSFLAEATDKSGMFSAAVVPGRCVDLPYKIYHYSRVAKDPAKISKRVRNADGFFHPADTLIPFDELPEYDFVARTHDHFSLDGFPTEVDAKYYKYLGKHPDGIEEWYSELT